MISFKTTTYGRVSFLEECLQSFLQQEYSGDSEMVIINDYPLQKLIFDHPKVRIFNVDETFKTIGEKENFAVEQCKGDIIAVTDDDDVYMQNHLSNIDKYFVPGTNILHWQRGVYYNDPEITNITWIGNSGMVYSKDAWLKAGKHPIMNAGGDSIFAEKVFKLGNVVHASPELPSAFYRWRMPNLYHQSGMGVDDETKFPSIIERHQKHIEGLRKRGLIPTGEVILEPHWNRPYDEMLNNFMKK